MPPKLFFLGDQLRPEVERQVPRGPLTVGQSRMINSKAKKLLDQFPEYTIMGNRIRLFTQKELLGFITCDTPLSLAADADFTNTVLDKRMGQTDRNDLCRTCGRGMMDCEGHPGAIPLPFTVVNPRFWVHVVAALRMICYDCGNVNLKRGHVYRVSMSEQKNISKIRDYGKRAETDRRCKRCGTLNYIYKDFSMLGYAVHNLTPNGIEFKRTKIENFSLMDIATIEDIFMKVDKSQWLELGFSNLPVDFLIKRLYVQPVCLRLREFIDSKLLESPETLFYDHIVKMIYLFGQNDLSSSETFKFREQLYDFIHLFMTGSRRKFAGMYRSIPTRTLQMIAHVKSVPEKVSSKAGFFRHDVMAKRTDYSARTVLGPAWTATFNEIEIPQMFSRCHTVPFHVTSFNINHARALWRSDYAHSVVLGQTSGRFYKAELKRNSRSVDYVIQPGDMIRRYLVNGDIVNFNRQPTLSRFSYMTYYIVVAKRKTLGLPSESTKTHNGDFDGDESNIHTAQNIGTIVEARTICAAENNIIGTTDSLPKAAMVYNSITSVYLLTGPDTRLDDEDFEYAASRWMNPNGAETYLARISRSGINPRSGSALFSIVFEPDFNYVNGSIEIIDGILVSGRLTKATLGMSSRGIVDILDKYHYAGATVNFLKLANRLLDWWLYAVQGFSVNFRDVFIQNPKKDALREFVEARARFRVDDNTLQRIHEIYNQGPPKTSSGILGEIVDFVEEYRTQLARKSPEFGLDEKFVRSIKSVVEENKREIEVTIAALPDPRNLTVAEKQKRKIDEINALNKLDRIGNKLAEEIFPPDNPFNVMVTSGSRGSRNNTTQIAGVLGEQFINGELPPMWCTRNKDYPDGSRCLPFFRPKGQLDGTHSIESTGFIANSFRSGLTPSEMVFHMASSRVGLIDTSLKSQTTGAFQRLMVKYLEDFKSHDDFSTRINGQVVQFLSMNGAAANRVISTWSQRKGKYQTAVDIDLIIDRVNAS